MPYNPNIHHRRSIRLKGYDYSKAGLYFITLCCQNRDHLFGKIINAQMCLNDAGVMVECWYAELQNKFPNVQCHEMVVMPNHFHCVVEIVDGGAEKGEHAGSPLPHTLSLLGTVVQWFKTMTTNEYIRGVKNSGWQPFDGKLWQRNYYENIIRNEISYQRIANYIDNNPVNWEKDRLK